MIFMRTFIIYHILTDCVYDYLDYILDPSLKIKEQTVFRLILNFLCILSYYFIFIRSKELIEKQKFTKNIKVLKSQANPDDSEAEIREYINQTTPVFYLYNFLVVLLTLFNITKEVFEVYDLEHRTSKQ